MVPIPKRSRRTAAGAFTQQVFSAVDALAETAHMVDAPAVHANHIMEDLLSAQLTCVVGPARAESVLSRHAQPPLQSMRTPNEDSVKVKDPVHCGETS
jgi:hypothetical protein